MNQLGLTILPYEILEIIGELSGWRPLAIAAMTCRDWYQWLNKFPWDIVMPMYRPWSNYRGENFNTMSMVMMLSSINTNDNKNIYTYQWDYFNESCNTNEITVINGIPIIKIERPIKTNLFKSLNKYLKTIDKHWDLQTLRKAKYIDIKSTTLPNIAKNKLYEQSQYDIRHGSRYLPYIKHIRGRFAYGFEYEDDNCKIYIDESKTDDFYNRYMILQYTGIVDFRKDGSELQLLSDTWLYCINIDTRTEISRTLLTEPGIKFFGFLQDHIYPCVLLIGGVIKIYKNHEWILIDGYVNKYRSYDRKGWYLIVNGNRLNMNKLNPIRSIWLDPIPILTIADDVDIPIIFDELENNYDLLIDAGLPAYKVLRDLNKCPHQNLYHATKYTAEFLSNSTDFNETSLPHNIPELIRSTHDVKELLRNRYSIQTNRDIYKNEELTYLLFPDINHEPIFTKDIINNDKFKLNVDESIQSIQEMEDHINEYMYL